jgi:hypothetical protein
MKSISIAPLALAGVSFLKLALLRSTPGFMSSKRIIFLSLLFSSQVLLHPQEAFVRLGGEYRISGGLPGDQVFSHSAISPRGGYLVWHDNAIDGDGLGIGALRLDSSLSGVLNPFRVNQEGAGDQEFPQVALLPNGGAVFVWQGGENGRQNIFARFLGPNGAFFTGDIRVNTYTQEQQITPAVAVLTNGDVVVVWASHGQDGSLLGVYGQRLSSIGGRKVGPEFQVNTYSQNNQRSPAVAALPNGNFVVVWISERFRGTTHHMDITGRNTDPGGGLLLYDVDLFGRLYSPVGVPLSGEIKLNSEKLYCANPSVSASENTFTVAWSGKPSEVRTSGSHLEGWNVHSRSFRLDGTPLGIETRLNTQTRGDQYAPKISSLDSEQLVVWTSIGMDGSLHGVSARLLSGTGEILTSEFRANQFAPGSQLYPSVASDGDKRFLVVWSRFVGGINSFDLSAQRYSSDNTLFPPSTPFVSALSQSRLSVTWPPVAGYEVAEYHLFHNNNPEPIILRDNMTVISGLLPGTEHSFRLGYRLADGRRSPISGSVTGRTWGEDANFDGLPDDWQAKYWGDDPSKWPPPHVDSDGDGATNLQEFLAGTNPIDPDSVLRADLVNEGGAFLLIWNAEPGQIYQVQVSSDTTSWSNVGGLRFAVSGTDSLPVPADDGVAIFRVIRMR